MVTEGTIISLAATMNYLSYNKEKEINNKMEEMSIANLHLIMSGLIVEGCEDEIDTVIYYISIPETSSISKKIFEYDDEKYNLSIPEELVRLYKRITVDHRYYNNDLYLRENNKEVYQNIYDNTIIRENIRKEEWTDEKYNEVDKYVSDTIDKIYKYIKVSRYRNKKDS